jgi:signal recognition particle subunit SRP54
MGFGDKLRDALDKVKHSMHVDKDLIKEVIKEIQRALISSDVNIQLVLNISKEIEEKAFEEIPSAITRKEHIVRLCYETLLKYMGGEIKIPLPENPETILLCGLFGSGKTTTAAKLSKFYKKRGFKVGVICADTYRPAAYEQLKQLSEMVGVDFYGNTNEKSAQKVTKEGLEVHKKNGCNLIIVDSAGRSALDSELVTEIKEINDVFTPKFSFLVISADIGQAVKDQATAFNNAIGVNGVIITKLDGSAKGGGALTACYITKSPVYFIGTGEKADDFEIFDSNRYLSRVLGFGDLESLIEKISEVTAEEEMGNIKDINPEDLLKGNVTFGIFKQQLEFSKKLGPFSKVLGFLGVGNKISNDQMNVGQKKMEKYKAILDSFTKEELKNGPDFLNRSRMDRISKGSGTSLEEVKELSSHIKKMKKMFKGMDAKKMEGMAKQFQGQNGEIDPNNLDMSKIDMNQFANMKGVKKKKLRFR